MQSHLAHLTSPNPPSKPPKPPRNESTAKWCFGNRTVIVSQRYGYGRSSAVDHNLRLRDSGDRGESLGIVGLCVVRMCGLFSGVCGVCLRTAVYLLKGLNDLCFENRFMCLRCFAFHLQRMYSANVLLYLQETANWEFMLSHLHLDSSYCCKYFLLYPIIGYFCIFLVGIIGHLKCMCIGNRKHVLQCTNIYSDALAYSPT